MTLSPLPSSSVTGRLLRLAIPTVGAGWLKSSFAVIDTISAGRIDAAALSGLTTGVVFAWIYHSLSYLCSSGAVSFVSRARGRGDVEKARELFGEAMRLAAVLGAGLSALFYFGAGPAIHAMGLDESIAAPAIAYVRGFCVLGAFFWVTDAAEQCLRAFLHAKTPLVVTFIFAGVNLGLNPLLATGMGGWPGLGMFGIGLATGVSCLGMSVTLLFLAHRRRLVGWASAGPLSQDRVLRFLRMMAVGAPVAISHTGFDLIWLVIMPYLARTGAVTVAAVGIGHRLEGLGYLTAVGIGHACAVLCGEAVGRRDIHGVVRTFWTAAAATVVVVGAWAAFLVVAGPSVVLVFCADTAVGDAAYTYIVICAGAMVLQVLETVASGAFEGIGRTAVPTAVAFLSYAIRIPLIILFASQGMIAVFIVVALTASVAGLSAVGAFFLFGRRMARAALDDAL